jgi:cyclopropane fatty-acyl-phospholipid synthase-like methyltransferase
MQFSLMTLLGLREEHTLLDIGCGSLRAGKLFLVYLLPDRYYGIEPERWLVEEGIERELGRDLVDRKRPRFAYASDFPCTSFGQQFDFILAQSIFSHASLMQIQRCLANAREAMKPSSIFAASFLEGDSDYGGDTWVYPGVVRYRAATVEKLATVSGLSCRRIDWFHIGGQAWFVFFRPGLEVEIDALATLNQMVPIKEQLTHYRARSDRLDQLESTLSYRVASRLWRLLRYRR